MTQQKIAATVETNPARSSFASRSFGTLVAEGAPDRVIDDRELSEILSRTFRALGEFRNVLLVPPDGSRPDAHARFLVEQSWQHYGSRITGILPALGTHNEMKPKELREFFGDSVPPELFLPHRWKSEVELVGTIAADRVGALTGGVYEKEFPVWLNRRLVDKSHDLIIATSHIVPHEVMGFAGYSKQLVIGLGGKPTIDLTHEIAARFGIDGTLGVMNTPSRRIINQINEHYLCESNVVYVMLVRAPAAAHEPADEHGMVTRGVYVGNGEALFRSAVKLSRQVNITVVDAPLERAVVYLPEKNYHSFWIAMKGSYRMRLAMAEGGELNIVCPGVKSFGEKPEQTEVITRYGYAGMSRLTELLQADPFLQANTGSWAHLTHGSPPESSPGTPKFRQVICPSLESDGLTSEMVRGVNMGWDDHRAVMSRFGLSEHSPVGYHGSGPSKVYYGGNPAKGLWLTAEAFATLDPV